MAAHSVSILTDMAAEYYWGENERESYAHAMDYAPAMDITEMGHQDWYTLRGLLEEGTATEVRNKAREVLCTQLQEWLKLGKPRNHEEWMEAEVEKDTTELIIEEIDKFDAQCAADEYTDTGEVWDLLNWIRLVLERE